jgi:hypothetical protein
MFVIYCNKTKLHAISGFHGGKAEDDIFWDCVPYSFLEITDVSEVLYCIVLCLYRLKF